MQSNEIIIENPNNVQNSIQKSEILPSENLCEAPCSPIPDNQMSKMPEIVENICEQVPIIDPTVVCNDAPEQVADALHCSSQQSIRPVIVEQIPVPEETLPEMSVSSRTQCLTEPPLPVNPIIQSSYAQLKQQIQSQQQFYKQFIDEFNQGLHQHKSNGLDPVSNRQLNGRHKNSDKIMYNGMKKKNIPNDIGQTAEENCSNEPVTYCRFKNCVGF